MGRIFTLLVGLTALYKQKAAKAQTGPPRHHLTTVNMHNPNHNDHDTQDMCFCQMHCAKPTLDKRDFSSKILVHKSLDHTWNDHAEEAVLSALTDLYNQIVDCQKCALAQGRNLAVPGEGLENAKIMFIGEAPGYHENRLGRPFVGAAGKFLEELLASINMRREEVYICNVIKCRPAGNRDPLPNEIEACRPYLDRQIELIRPRLIVTLGRHSMARYLPKASISKIHGRPTKFGEFVVLPLFHPAAALHQPKYRADIERDILRIPEVLAQMDGLAEAQQEQQAEQLSLF